MSQRRPMKEAAEGASSSKRRRVEEEEDDDLQMSQGGDEGLGKETAECGIIEHVLLKNFMCHSRLEFRFCPNVNFIIGRNGSGKSALLTALVVGLGGKASVTNRGTSIKSFIKDGKQVAEVTVKLKNCGPDAYHPDIYGDSIIVERRFSADGSSQYKLKDSRGKLVSNKREELSHICEDLNIQVDNPVAILNQDTSKNFLNTKSPHDKYKFFLKATQLEQMKMDYISSNEAKEVSINILQQKKETLPDLEKEVLDWEQKFKAISTLDDQRKKVESLIKEVAWAFVAEREREMEPMLKKIRVEEDRLPKFEGKVKESQTKMEEKQLALKNLGEQVKKTAEEAAKVEPELGVAKSALNEKKKSLRTATNEARQIDSNLRSAAKDRDFLHTKIEEIRKSAQQDYQNEREIRKQKIDDLQGNLEEHTNKARTTEHQIEQFALAGTRLREQEFKLKAEDKDLRGKIDRTKRDIQNLESARKNKMQRFGEKMPQAVQRMLEAANKRMFHKQPVGPLGSMIHLKEADYALAVEQCLGGLLKAFCCHDHHDEAILQKIFASVFPRGLSPPIIVSAFQDQLHDVSQFRVRSKYATVLDVLEFDNPVVHNCLIDQRGIENVILIPDPQEARHVMMRNPPKHCKEAFDHKGDHLYCAPTFRYYSSNQNKPHFLTKSVEDDIRNCKQELDAIQLEQRDVAKRMLEGSRELQQNTSQERRHQTQLNKLRNEITNIKFEIDELKNTEDPAPVDVATLEEELQAKEDEIASYQSKKVGVTATLNSSKEQMNEANSKVQELEARIRAIVEDQEEPLKEKFTRLEYDVDQARNHKKHYEKKLKDQQKLIEEKKTELEEFREQLQADIAAAEQKCPTRIQTRRAVGNLKSEITQIQRQLAAEEKNQGNREEITRKYNETFNALKKIKSDVHKLDRFLDQLDAVMKLRQKQYNDFRRMIAIRAKYFFIVMLNNRNYIGKMAFDHQKETLALSVQPTSNKGEGSKDMKSLSGGERSFSTVCFILSLWDAMESPFRCLDEFDVFMDLVNRRIAMDMMLSVARNQSGKQFIFLTPQDMSRLANNLSSSLQIFKMPDPETGQGVLTRDPEEEDEEAR